jgi:DNA-binding NarL/FixJ family response regulator
VSAAQRILGLSPLDDTSGAARRSAEIPICLIGGSVLVRGCMAKCIAQAWHEPVRSYATADDWRLQCGSPAGVVILLLTAEKCGDDVLEEVRMAHAAAPEATLIVVGNMSSSSVVEVLEVGARGFVPMAMPLDLALEVLRFVKAGGTFIPAECLIDSCQAIARPAVSTAESARDDPAICISTSKQNVHRIKVLTPPAPPAPAVPGSECEPKDPGPSPGVDTSKAAGLTEPPNEAGKLSTLTRSCNLTARQAAVVDALRRGMANKAIAHALRMQESTVKVHVRNVMKKLRASNRTEVAFIVGRHLDALESDDSTVASASPVRPKRLP